MYSIEGKTFPTVTDTGIYGFFQEYRFLSNFHLCNILYKDIWYPSSEHCYMAQKTNDISQKMRLSCSGGLKVNEAKHYGQSVELIPNWDNIRYDVMLDVVTHKFSQNEDIKQLLLDTGDKYLEETNWWRDKYWGCHIYPKQPRDYSLPADQYGQNNLGKILMIVRDRVKEQT